jgi:nucleoside-diphosphate-sugar epimerase
MLIPSLVRAVNGDRALPMTAGEQVRDFIYVDDVAEAMLRLAVAPGARGEIVNVGRGESVSIRDTVGLLEQLSGRRAPVVLGAIPYREGEIMDYRMDISKLERLTGFSPRTPLREGLTRTLADRVPASRPSPV